MQRDSLRESVIKMIRAMTSRSERIDHRTRILHDLSIAGDDASDLLAMIEEQLGPITIGMEFHDYFPDKSRAMFYRRGEFLGLWKPKKELTVGHLLTCIEQGRWVEPGIRDK